MTTARTGGAPTPRHCGKPLFRDAESYWWCQVCRGYLEADAGLWEQVYGGDLEAIGVQLRPTYESRPARPPANPQIGRR
ncbi:hypothetical protein VSR01_16325 [Actinacidiphila sp. DG2A-62]|uniref:hypothetical protein n=1 Tax=Actinacidiphila sp. DG2A-62 TaxID=3108821 RepID=UPI002DBA2625|nr:hypothetical protein [Actinacidiphila sp. DG2A-62]MEC3995012.1 hypothetical protein [Actinacidiphila sp. DG2A-62]